MRPRKLPLIVLALLVGSILFWIFRPGHSYWDGSRLRVVIHESTGAVYYTLFDPRKSEVLIYPLKGEREVDTAYGLGLWKVASLWKLGEQEKMGSGALLTRSLIKDEALPIEAYINVRAGATDPFRLARELVSSLNTDMSLTDRLQLALFTLRATVNVEPTLDEQDVRLTGESLNKISDGIVTVYSDKSLSQDSLHVLSAVIANLGGKVLDITSATEELKQCKVKAANSFGRKLARVFGCHFEKQEKEGIEFYSGSEFNNIF